MVPKNGRCMEQDAHPWPHENDPNPAPMEKPKQVSQIRSKQFHFDCLLGVCVVCVQSVHLRADMPKPNQGWWKQHWSTGHLTSTRSPRRCSTPKHFRNPSEKFKSLGENNWLKLEFIRLNFAELWLTYGSAHKNMGGGHSPNAPMETTNQSGPADSGILLRKKIHGWGFHTFFLKGPLNTQTLVSAIVFFSARPFWGCQSGGWHRPNYEHLSWDNQCPLETCARTERHPRKKTGHCIKS